MSLVNKKKPSKQIYDIIHKIYFKRTFLLFMN